MLKSVLNFLLIAAIAVGGVWGVHYIKTTRIRLQPRANEQRPPVNIERYTVGDAVVSASSRVKGVTEAVRTARVTSEISGRLEFVNQRAEIGYLVAEGEELARIDTSLLLLDLNTLEISLESSKLAVRSASLEVVRLTNELSVARENLAIVTAVYKRNVELFQSGSLSQNAMDLSRLDYLNASRSVQSLEDGIESAKVRIETAEVGVKSVEAQITKMKETISKAIIRAPWQALISRKSAELGEFVAPGTALFVLQRCDSMYFTVSVPAEDFAVIEKGASAKVRLYDVADIQFTGKVENLGVEGDVRARSYSVQIALDLSNAKGNIRPGFFGEAEISIADRKFAVAVPTRSVMNDGGKPYVYVINNGKAELRYIKTAHSRQGYIEVIEGLAKGEVVAATGADRLVTGADIEPPSEGVAPIGGGAQ